MSTRGRPASRHFTLVELMIVIAVLMVLAAIAVPFVQQYQLRAKRSEVDLITNGIADGLAAAVVGVDGLAAWSPLLCYAGVDPITDPDFCQSTAEPPGTAGKAPRTWSAGDDQWLNVFAPDGQLRGAYVYYFGGTSTGMGVLGYSDVDADGTDYQRWVDAPIKLGVAVTTSASCTTVPHPPFLDGNPVFNGTTVGGNCF